MKFFKHAVPKLITLLSLSVTGNTYAESFANPAHFTKLDDYESAYTFSGQSSGHTSGYTGGKGGSAFNDMDDIKAKDPSIKPNRITIRSGARIDNIKITYGYKKGHDEFYTEHGGYGGGVGEFELEDYEYITKVVMCSTGKDRWDGRVGRITFTKTNHNTNASTDYTYGNSGSHCSTYQPPTDWHIIGFQGRSGSEVDMLWPIYALKLKLKTTRVLGDPSFSERIIDNSYTSYSLNNSTAATTNDVSYIDINGHTATTNWSNTSTFDLGFTISYGVSADIMAPAGGSISTEYSFSMGFTNSFQYGKSNTEDTIDRDTKTFRFTTNPGKVQMARINVTKRHAIAPLNIEYENIHTGDKYYASGNVVTYDSWESQQSTEEFGVFDQYGVIQVHPHFLSNDDYACYHNKTKHQAEASCLFN